MGSSAWRVLRHDPFGVSLEYEAALLVLAVQPLCIYLHADSTAKDSNMAKQVVDSIK